jgi:formamidopyrimidine-DNA glycosylase
VPELPEVETARSLIADHALHRRIVGVDDADTFVCRPHSPGQLRDALAGRTLTAARRRGKAMWCETSGIGPSAVPGPDLGIHLGMGGRIVVVSRSGQAAEGGGPRRRDAQPHKEEWNRFTLEFADGGRLVLFDKRRLGRIRLNPDIDALGPDAGQVTPTEFRNLHHGFARPARDRRSRRAAERDRRWNRDDLMRIEAVDIQASNMVSMAITGSSAGQPDVP